METYQPQRGCIRRLPEGRNPVGVGWHFFDERVLWRGVASAHLSQINQWAGRQDAAATKENEAGPKSDLINRETNLSQK